MTQHDTTDQSEEAAQAQTTITTEAAEEYLREMSQHAAARFIKNVCVIDNEMSMDGTGTDHGLDIATLAAKFSDQGIACSIYRPNKPPAEERNIIVKLIRQCDAAILDWQLLKDSDPEASEPSTPPTDITLPCKEIIKSVLTLDRNEGLPPRMIAVYTGERVTLDLPTKLKEHLDEFQLRLDEDSFGLIGKNTRIVFWQKPYLTQNSRRALAATSSCAIEDIPQKIISEYSLMTGGLLPAAVLHGLSALRENTHSLLSIFGTELDPAMVLHSLMIPNTGDAPDFLISLLSDECHRILEDCTQTRSILNETSLTNWTHRKENYTTTQNGNQGIQANKLKEHISKAKGKKQSDLLELIYSAENWKTDGLSFCRLAQLRRESHPPLRRMKNGNKAILSQGTIIKFETDYYLCLMPRCDTVRLKNEPRGFPFIKLETASSEKNASISIHTDGHNINLQYPTKTSWAKLKIIRFKDVDRVESFTSEGKIYFQDADDDKRRYEWIADMKKHIAAKIASDLAPGLSRIGMDEFEWQRCIRPSQ